MLGPLRRTGQATYRVIETLDGAPLIGRSGRNRTTVIAGLGASAAFVAPAVARPRGQRERGGAGYFGARDVTNAAHRQSVVETEPAAAEAAA